jgi:hypothetical protein
MSEPYEDDLTTPAEPTPAPQQITGDQVVASIMNLNARLAKLEDIHKKALKTASQENKYRLYRG